MIINGLEDEHLRGRLRCDVNRQAAGDQLDAAEDAKPATV